MSVNITIRDAIKRYGDNTVIQGLSLDIKEGEFFTLLGPSGCGKTTLLRMIAGFNTIEGGSFYFNDELINNVNPSDRNIGMVFQNYAIFPHLTVFENVAFGLRQQKLSNDEINRRVNDVLETMQIKEYADRMPEKLSGGQQQRVALARAVVIKPNVLLMDEPLSNLDAKLRIDMRTAIKEIQQSVNITTVYVTHDQEEAMSVSDRIAVMKDGYIQHVGTPQNIYQRPANLFVSKFIGRTNVLNGELKNNELILHDTFTMDFDYDQLVENYSGKVKVSIRPEEFNITRSDQENTIPGEVVTAEFLGLNTHYGVRLFNDVFVDIVEESDINHLYQPGDRVFVSIKKDRINIFNDAGSYNLVKGVENDHA
ncbi:MAG: ABC transporter ATP-binding protein [Erysipelothrix sp.]|nr:ABC transporter ATP-binding protein [Erysipelothrix sp.]